MNTTEYKSLNQLPLDIWNDLVNTFKLSSYDEWEKIVDYFIGDIFSYENKVRIKQIANKPNFSAIETVLQSLKAESLPIERLYKCVNSLELFSCSEYIEKKFPYLFSQKANPVPNVASNLESNNVIDSLKLENIEDMSQNKINANNTADRESAQINSIYTSVFILINTFETILPVIQESLQPTKTQSTSYSYDQNMSVNHRFSGKFEKVYINERKLSFKRREFNVIDYVIELKMIKYRHANLYTAECIYKILDSQIPSYFLLYGLDNTAETYTLSEYANQFSKRILPGFDLLLNQLSILKDVSCGLAYLHNFNGQKKAILHGNLQPDFILIEIKNDQITAKIYDFTKAIEIEKNEIPSKENEIREEYYKLGMIVYLILTWRLMSKEECADIHREDKRGEVLYKLSSEYKIGNNSKIPETTKMKINLTYGKLFGWFYDLTNFNSGNVDKLDKVSNFYNKIHNETVGVLNAINES